MIKRKKNGFTIVELVITIGLIVLVGFLVTNSIIAVTKKNNEKDYVSFSNKLEKGACTFVELDVNKYDCDEHCLVQVQDLISEGLIDEDLTNPKTKEKVKPLDAIYVVQKDGEKKCYYNEDNVYDFEGPIITYGLDYYKVDITITDVSGLKGYTVTDSKDKPEEYIDISGTIFKVTKDFTKPTVLYVHAIDIYNNYSMQELNITNAYIDTEPPKITGYFNGNTLSVTITDNYELKGYEITEKPTPSGEYKNINGARVSVDHEVAGIGTYYVHAIDRVNLKTTYSLNYSAENEWDFSECTKTIEDFVVPYDGYYQIDVTGGRGGQCAFCRAASFISACSDQKKGTLKYANHIVSGVFKLNKDDVLKISVGCQGGSGDRRDDSCTVTPKAGSGGYYGGIKGSGIGHSGSGGVSTVALIDGNYDVIKNNLSNVLITAKGGYGCYKEEHTDQGYDGIVIKQAGGGDDYINTAISSYGNYTNKQQAPVKTKGRVRIRYISIDGYFSVNYDSTGGSSCTPLHLHENDKYGKLCTPTRDKYTFDGWYDELGNKVTNDSIFAYRSHITLTAKWKSNFTCRRALELHSEACPSGYSYCQGALTGSSTTVYNYGNVNFGNLSTNTSKLTVGEALDCDLNDDGIFDGTTERFYYIATTSGKAELLYYGSMDGTKVVDMGGKAYNADSSNNSKKGPKTTRTYLPKATLWPRITTTNINQTIPIPGGTTFDFIYEYKSNNITYTNVARLLDYSHLASACNITSATNIDKFLVNHECRFLLERTIFINKKYKRGYWTQNVDVTAKKPYYIDGKLQKISLESATSTSVANVRPVIDVPISQIDLTVSNTPKLTIKASEAYTGCEDYNKALTLGAKFGPICKPTLKDTTKQIIEYRDQFGRIVYDDMIVTDLLNHELTPIITMKMKAL